MYLNNKIINFLKSEINTIKLEDNKELYINFIISFVRECYKNKINQSSEDIYDLINSNIIKNVSNIKNYINLNLDKLKDKELPQSYKDICLITYIYDEFNSGWFQYVTSIFDNILVITISNNFSYF